MLKWLRRSRQLGRSPERVLRVSGDGVELADAVIGDTLWRFKWAELQEIVAFKVDGFTVDHICLGFRDGAGSLLHVTDEDTPGWRELNDELAARYGVVFESWFASVAFPAFKENWTVLWTRKAD